ncbi:MAG: hypothetical protein MJ016_02125, partial [Victivallaceae bacterium]|nr:hypothetical protein [Victivallaceae bacterium]
MPKIPMIENAQIRVAAENLPEARAQQMYDTGEATGNFARGLQELGSAAVRLTGAVAQWGADLAAEADKEKIAELELMQTRIDHEITLQAENAPERYTQFGEDSRLIEESYAERKKELLEGLSPQGRARAQAMLAERSENRQFNIARLSRRAAVEYGFKQSESQ